MQLKLETNLPVIFLTLLVIAVVVMGYLELKKMNERIEKVKNYKELYSVIKDLKEEVDYHEFNLKNMLN